MENMFTNTYLKKKVKFNSRVFVHKNPMDLYARRVVLPISPESHINWTQSLFSVPALFSFNSQLKL